MGGGGGGVTVSGWETNTTSKNKDKYGASHFYWINTFETNRDPMTAFILFLLHMRIITISFNQSNY